MRLQKRHDLSKHHANGRPGGTLTLSLLGSSSRTLSVPMNNRPFKASRRVRTTLIQHVTLEGEGGPAGSHALHRLGLPLRSAKHAVSRWRRKPCSYVLNPLLQQTSVVTLPVRVATLRGKRRMQETLLSQCLKKVEYVKNGGNSHQDEKGSPIETPKTFCKEQYSTYQCKQIESQSNQVVSSLVHGVPLFLLHVIEQLRSFNAVCVGVSSSHTTKSLIGGVQNTWASGMLASVQYVPFPPVGSSAVEVTR